jgi:predicted RNA binding protein YcfA (HicA-like mRNA interferase family)
VPNNVQPINGRGVAQIAGWAAHLQGLLLRTIASASAVIWLKHPRDRFTPVKVREIVRELEEEGWLQTRQAGSHRQFRHPTKPGTVTVPGRMGDELAKGTVGSIVRQARLARRQR